MSKLEELDKCIIEYKEFKVKIDEYNCNSKKMRDNISSYSRQKITHLVKVLNKGADYREEGMSWIIKQLWLMGVRVRVNDISSNLNKRNALFLFEKAKIEVVLAWLRQWNEENKSISQNVSQSVSKSSKDLDN